MMQFIQSRGSRISLDPFHSVTTGMKIERARVASEVESVV